MDIVFTIATNSHLGNAKALMDSFHKHNNNYQPVICVIDDYNSIPTELRIGNDIIICNYKDLQLDEVESMAKRYTPFEFSCAMKPFFAEYILNKYEPLSITYLDSDIIIFDNLELNSFFQNFSILLTPHCTAPYQDMDLNLLNYGLYNAGFFGVKNDSNSESFLKWWKKNLVDDCIIDLANGKYVDQIWLNLVPLYFDDVHIINNPGYNVARWNLAQRKITKNNNRYIVDQKDSLKFFHYSGYNVLENKFPVDNPNILNEVNSKCFQSIIKEINNTLLKNNVQKYRRYRANYGYIDSSDRKSREKGFFRVASKFIKKCSWKK